MKITWLTQGSFLFDTGQTRILVDPYISNALEAKGIRRMTGFPLKPEEVHPDIFVATHDHADHLDPEAAVLFSQKFPSCMFAGGISCFEKFIRLGIARRRCILMECGKQIDAPGMAMIPVPAYHSDPHSLGMVLLSEKGKIYLSGDTEYGAGLINENTRNCRLMLVCINGRLGNMDSNDAVKLAVQLNPSIALPMHYGLFAENTADPAVFINGCIQSGIRSWEMEPGKEFSI